MHELLMAAFDPTVPEEELYENFDEHDDYAIESSSAFGSLVTKIRLVGEK
jgi:hypothetical protein